MDKKSIILGFLLLNLILFLSVCSAVDNSNQNTTSSQSHSLEKVKVNEDNHNVKSSEIQPKTVKLDSTNFDEYVNNGRFNDEVNEGDTIDIQGKIDDSKFSLIIDKPLNFISSTNNSYLDFNTIPIGTSGQYKNGVFNIINGASGTNVTGLYFHNTRIMVDGASNVNINNITSIANTNIGNGVGSFSIRGGSENVTVTNSTFTNHGTGHSNVVIAGASNCIIENNTIQGIDGSGNLLYATSYGASGDNKDIAIRNNIIKTINIPSSSAICWGLVLQGTGFLIENNYIDTNYPVEGQYSDSEYGVETIVEGVIFNNNTIARAVPHLTFPGIVSNNVFMEGALLTNNYAVNNTFRNVNLVNNVRFENNIAYSIGVDGVNNTIIGSEVFTDEDYAVTINGVNNTLIDNRLASYKGRGENAINNKTEFTSMNNSEDINRIFYFDDNNWEKYMYIQSNNYRVQEGFVKSNDIIYVNLTQTHGNLLSVAKLTKTDSLTIITNTIAVSTPAKLTIINSTTYNLKKSGSSSAKELTLINSIIRESSCPVTLINSSILRGTYSTYPKDNTYLLDEGKIIFKNGTYGLFNKTVPAIEPNSRLDVRSYVDKEEEVGGGGQGYHHSDEIFFNIPLEIVGLPNHENIIDSNVSFIEGSEGTTVRNIVFNKSVFTGGNIIFSNCTFKGDVFVNGSYVTFDNNIFDGKILFNSTNYLIFNNNTVVTTDDVPVTILNSRNARIENNTINTTADNTIVFDDTSRNNIVRNNILKSNSLYGNDTVQSAGNTVEGNTPSYDTKIFITVNDVLFVNSDNEVNISVKNVNKDVLVDKGYVEVYLDGIYSGTYNLINGQVTVNPSTNKVSLGTVQLKVWYYDGITYSNNVTSINVNVAKANVAISVEEIQAKLNENTTVKATFIDQQGKYLDGLNATFTVGRTVYNVTIHDGIAKLEEIVSTEWLDAGRIKIDSPKTDKYNSNTTTIKLDVEKGDINVESDINVEAVNAEISMNLTNILNENITDGTITVTTSNGTILAQEEVTNGVFNKNVTIPYGYKDDYLVASYTDSYYYKDFEITLEYTRINNSTATLDEESVVVGSTTQITAKLATEEGITVDGGEVIFRVNGKTLRDNDGNVIYVEVKDGIATLENINITREWLKPDTYIQAVYSGNDEFESFVTQKTNVTVTKPEATVTITSKLEAKAGDNITLSASIMDNDKAINSGRVVFKLNGKTLKGEDGKALYVDVKDGVATTNYLLPVKTKAKTYTLTAVFTDTNYNRSEAEADFVVTS